MKRIVTSLPFRLLLGVVIGIIAGQLSGTALMNIVVTVKFVLGELINFCVPLIIIGFIAPSITRLGKNASRMLGAAVFCAYVSSILAALLSMGAGYGLIPHLSVVTETGGLKELPELVFRLEIPQIMTVSQILYGEIPSVGFWAYLLLARPESREVRLWLRSVSSRESWALIQPERR